MCDLHTMPVKVLLGLGKVKGKVLLRAMRPIEPGLKSGFYSVKRTGGEPPPGQDASLSLEYPPAEPGTHLYTWVE